MKPRGMKIEMSRVGFIELYRYMERLKACTSGNGATPGFPPSFSVDEFLDRNREKFSKIGNIVDETIQFPVLSYVEFTQGENGQRRDPNTYIVIRAKKLPNGKREYWLWNTHNQVPRRVGSLIKPDRKVGGASLRAANNISATIFTGYKLPRPT